MIIAAFAGIAYGLHVLLHEGVSLEHVYIIPLLLSFIVVTLPFILKLMNKVKQNINIPSICFPNAMYF